MRKHRLVVRAVGVATALLIASATPAAAFECYNAVRSAQGNLSAAQSRALMSIQEVLADAEIVGLCPEGVEFVVAGLKEAGFRTDVLINFRTLMAGGLEMTHPDKLHDESGIDHLSEDFFATVDPLIEEAFGLCAE